MGETIAVDDMHQRKAEMARLADAFIALPGICIVLEGLPPYNGHMIISCVSSFASVSSVSGVVDGWLLAL